MSNTLNTNSKMQAAVTPAQMPPPEDDLLMSLTRRDKVQSLANARRRNDLRVQNDLIARQIQQDARQAQLIIRRQIQSQKERDATIVRHIRTNRTHHPKMHPTIEELRSAVSVVLDKPKSWVTEDTRDEYELKVRRKTSDWNHLFRYQF